MTRADARMIAEELHKLMLKDNEIKDVYLTKEEASWLEHSDVHKMVESVDEDEKVRSIVPTLGGNQESWMLTENGLYEVFILSPIVFVNFSIHLRFNCLLTLKLCTKAKILAEKFGVFDYLLYICTQIYVKSQSKRQNDSGLRL